MIRFVLVCVAVVGFLILSIPILVVEWVIGKFSPRAKDVSSLRIVQAVFRFILWLAGTDVTYIGLENIPDDQAVLFIGNHRSYFDILLTYTQCRRLTGYVAKIEMEKIPLLSTWMRYLHCLFLDRKDLKQGLKTILTCIEKVRAGISICIFPEGTRNQEAESELDLLEFHEGSFRIASKTNCPIVPMALTNTISIFEKQAPRIRRAKVIVEYGNPILPSELPPQDKKFLGKYTKQKILEMLKEHEKIAE